MQTLCQQTWSQVLGYLELHHHARLFRTGDKLVQTRVIFARRSFRPLPSQLDDAQSRLVCDLLVPYADDAVVSYKWLEKSSVIGSPTQELSLMRSLTITSTVGEYVNPISIPAYRCGDCVLSNLVNLQTLVLDNTSYLRLLLPSSLTSLTMHDCCFSQVVNMKSLVSLVHLNCPFEEDGLRRATENNSWPPSLTSLDVTVTTLNGHSKEHLPGLKWLPATLLHLGLRAFYRSNDHVLNIFPPNVCTRLESFKISRVQCAFEFDGEVAFPPSLKRLELEEVKFDSSVGVAPAVASALRNSSITDFRIASLRLPDVDSMSSIAIDEHRKLLLTILHMLQVDSLIEVTRLLVKTDHCDSAVTDMCIRSFAGRGLCENFFNFVACSQWFNVSGAIEAADKCEDQHLVSRYLRERLEVRNNFERYAYFSRGNDERISIVKWMAAHDVPPQVKTTLLCDLDQMTISKLEDLVVVGDKESLASAFSSWQFDSVRQVRMSSASVGPCDTIVEVLHANRSRFPLLTCFSRRVDQTLTAASIAMLAEMRLYPGRVSADFTYGVAPLASGVK